MSYTKKLFIFALFAMFFVTGCLSPSANTTVQNLLKNDMVIAVAKSAAQIAIQELADYRKIERSKLDNLIAALKKIHDKLASGQELDLSDDSILAFFKNLDIELQEQHCRIIRTSMRTLTAIIENYGNKEEIRRQVLQIFFNHIIEKLQSQN